MNRSQHLSTLDLFITLKPLLQKFFLLHCSETFVEFIIDCVFNIIKGTVSLNLDNQAINKFKTFERIISILCDRRVKINSKRKLLSTDKGIRLLKMINDPIQKNFKSTI